MNKIDFEIKKTKDRLARLYKKIQLAELLKGFSVLVIVAFVTNLILVFFELIGLNSVDERTVLFYLGVVFVSAVFIYFITIPILKLLKPLKETDYIKLTEFVGKQFPEIDDKLLNTFQLYKDKKKSELKDAAIISQLKKTETFNFNSVISFVVLKNIYLFAFASIISMVLLFSVFASMRNSAIRILNYSNEYVIPQKYKFYIEPGNAVITKGEDVQIKIEAIGKQPLFINLFIKDEVNPSYKKINIFPDTNNVFRYILNSLTNTTDYYISAEDVKSDEYKITVINRPVINNLELKITPPAYTKLESTIQKDNGNIFAFVGSNVELKIISSKKLKSAELVFSDSTKVIMNKNQNTAKGKFRITKNKNYKINIIDTANNANANPIEYSIKSKVDKFPVIKIVEPKEDLTLTKTETVNAILRIKDDFGFSRLIIRHKLTSTNYGIPEEKFSTQIIPIDKNRVEQEVFYLWNLSERMLAAGDVLSFYFEVFDNDVVSGPKSVKSKIFQLRVPTMEEIFKTSEAVQEEVKTDLDESLKEAEKLKEEMKKLSNELKKDDKKISWEEKKKIEETAKHFQELQKKIEEAQKKIETAKKNLDNNNLLSKETLKKYNELQKLLGEMNSEEMKKVMEKLQQQLQSMNRDKAQQAMEQMQFDEEAFKKSIERTVNLLKRIQIEQKTEEVIKRTEELQKKLDELKKETEQSNLSKKEQKDELAKKEDEISKQFERLKEEMKKLQEKMSKFNDMPNDMMEQIQKEMKAQNNEELTEQMKEMLQQNMQQEALEQMQQFSQNMEQMKNSMQQMQQQMQQQNQMQVLFDMMKNLNNLLTLSKEEESLKNSTEKGNPNTDEYMKNIQKQKEISDGLQKTLNNLTELSQKTFAITPEMGKALGNANREMNRAMQAIQNRNSSLAILSQTGAMKYLNEAAAMIKGNMEQMMNGGQGGGMMSMMQQMQQLSQQQMQFNQLTKQMQQGKLTPQQQAQMQRLAQQQEIIRKSLEQLNKENKESGKSKTLASNLDQILKEMKEVITNMNTNKIDNDLIKTQEHILSKLLDAQRSINERDFEKNRESNAGKNFNRKSPGELNLNSEKEKIKDELMKIINEGYSKDYEELIKKYYEILEKEKENEISE